MAATAQRGPRLGAGALSAVASYVDWFCLVWFSGDHRSFAVPDLGLAVPSAFHRNKSGAADETPLPFAEGLCKARGCQGSELPHGGKLFQGEVFSLPLRKSQAQGLTSKLVFHIVLCGLGQNVFQIHLLRPEGWFPV